MWTIYLAPLFQMTSNVPAASHHAASDVPHLSMVADLLKASDILAAIKTGLQAVVNALSKHQLQLGDMTFLRICTPKYSSGPPLHTEGMWQLIMPCALIYCDI